MASLLPDKVLWARTSPPVTAGTVAAANTKPLPLRKSLRLISLGFDLFIATLKPPFVASLPANYQKEIAPNQ